MKDELVANLLLQVDEELDALHLALAMKDEEAQAKHSDELKTIHETLRILSYFPSDTKLSREKVEA